MQPIDHLLAAVLQRDHSLVARMVTDDPDLLVAANMFGAGQPLDTGKYFVIASDSIGTGKSSKPSDGLRMSFPRYRLDDVVQGQK